MKYSITILTLLTLMALASCQGSEKPSPGDQLIASEIPEEENPLQEQQDKVDRPLEEGEVREYGRVLAVEDGVYPMFLFQLEFPETGIVLDFDVNIEAIDLVQEDLNGLNGRFVTLYYKNVVVNDLQAVMLEGKNILDGPEAGSNERLIEVQGVLKGAEKMTESDLPSTVSVVDGTGKQTDFPLYIGPELLEGNGKEVTAKYSEKMSQLVTYIRPADGV